MAKVFESWRISLYSFEWLHPDGKIKTFDELPGREADKRRAADQALDKGEAVEKPVMGLGVMDNVEIGSGRALFLCLYDRGVKTMPVHIPKASLDDFKEFMSNEN